MQHAPEPVLGIVEIARRAPLASYVIVVAFIAIWIGHFGMRVHGTYEKLAFDYGDAEKKVALAQQRHMGHNVRLAFGKELADAEKLLSMSRFWRAWYEEWRHSYVCGDRSCWSLVFGEKSASTVIFYCAIMIAVALIFRGFVVQSFLFAMPDYESQRTTHLKSHRSHG